MFIEHQKNVEVEKLKEMRKKQRKKNLGKYYNEYIH